LSTLLKRLLVTNPLLEEATRARRKFFRVTGGPGKALSYVVIAIIGLFYFWLLAEVVLARGGGPQIQFLMYFQLVIVTLAMPLSVYGAISGERERSTWEALVLTRLTPGQIVVGKMLWRVGWLLVVMALFLVPILLTMTSPEENLSTWNILPPPGAVASAELMTFFWGFGLSSYGLWISANTRKSVTSAALIFISLLSVLVLLPILLSMILGSGQQEPYSGNYVTWIMTQINPFLAMSQVLDVNHGSTDGPMDNSFGNMLGGLQSMLYVTGTAVFLYATFRTLRLWEEHKNRIG
jgi:hypothetical protein